MANEKLRIFYFLTLKPTQTRSGSNIFMFMYIVIFVVRFIIALNLLLLKQPLTIDKLDLTILY